MSAERFTITVDGREVSVAPRTLLLHVLREQRIEVPTLCHDDRLTPYGGCRLCVVARRDGRGGMIPSCSTPVERGMVIETSPPEVIEARRQQLQLLVMNHRMECPVCERRGDCSLQDLLYRYGTPEAPLPFERRLAPRDEASPLIVRDPEKCVLCGKCVRLCDEVQGVAEIGIVNRGMEAHVTTIHGAPLDCEFCGQCVEACPVGALVARPFDTSVPVWMRTATATTCTFCSAGCGVRVETHEGALLRVSSVDGSGVERGKLCVKGRFGWDLLAHPDRVTRPLLRHGGELRPATWDEALDAIVSGIGRARSAGKAVVGFGSARLSNEAAFHFQDLLRRGAGTPHVGFGRAAGVDALVDGVMPVLGSPRSTATFGGLVEAQTVLVVRGDPTRTHPLAKTQIVQGVNQKGHRLIMAHATTGGLERHARPFLPLRPGSEEAFLLGLTNIVVESGAPGAQRLESTAGFEAWRHSLAAYSPAVVAEATGVGEAALREVASALLASDSVVGVVVTAEGLAGDEAAAARAMAYLLLALDRIEGAGPACSSSVKRGTCRESSTPGCTRGCSGSAGGRLGGLAGARGARPCRSRRRGGAVDRRPRPGDLLAEVVARARGDRRPGARGRPGCVPHRDRAAGGRRSAGGGVHRAGRHDGRGRRQRAEAERSTSRAGGRGAGRRYLRRGGAPPGRRAGCCRRPSRAVGGRRTGTRRGGGAARGSAGKGADARPVAAALPLRCHDAAQRHTRAVGAAGGLARVAARCTACGRGQRRAGAGRHQVRRGDGAGTGVAHDTPGVVVLSRHDICGRAVHPDDNRGGRRRDSEAVMRTGPTGNDEGAVRMPPYFGSTAAVATDGLPAEVYAAVDAFVAGTPGGHERLIPLLHRAQQSLGYLPFEIQEYIADALGLTPIQVYEVVSFYHFFSTTPKGMFRLKVCMGTACFVRHAERLVRHDPFRGRARARREPRTGCSVSRWCGASAPAAWRRRSW